MTKIFITVFTLFSFGVSANPYERTVIELFNLSKTENELSFAISAAVRCAGVLNEMSLRTEKDFPDKDVSANLESLYFTSMQVAALFQQNMRVNAGYEDFSVDDALTEISPLFLAHHKKYQEWMNENFLKTGELFGSDSVLKNELDTCMEFAGSARKRFQ